jgi:mannose-1-phosphate guanylyltransferase
MLIPVILSGGVGARLWPVSRESFPKPFMKLADGDSLLCKTYRRALTVAEGGHILTVTNRDYYFMSRDELSLAGADAAGITGHFLLEPSGRNTAPAIALAALQATDAFGPETLLLVLAADHLIQDVAGFADSAGRAAELAREGYLVTFGIEPTAPETGFGYIEKGAALGSGFKVARFVEKPSLEKAEAYLGSGNYLWNSGMFCFSAGVLLDELQRQAPEIHDAARACWQKMREVKPPESGMLEIPAAAFAAVPSISIDYAVMEKSPKVAVVAASFDWSDVGSWSAVSGLVEPDTDNNRAEGEAVFVDSRNTYIKSEGRLIAALGLDNLLIIDTPDALLVAHADKAQDVKHVVTELKSQNHPACSLRRTGVRPWGTYTVLEQESRYKIKRIEVWPGRSLSLQMHHHRSEHWVVVSGMAKVINGEQERFVGPNESTYIPAGCAHRLSNPGLVNLVLIEVQSGEYLEEDDIVRFQDDYGRQPA